jgi:hypothetical protein
VVIVHIYSQSRHIWKGRLWPKVKLVHITKEGASFTVNFDWHISIVMPMFINNAPFYNCLQIWYILIVLSSFLFRNSSLTDEYVVCSIKVMKYTCVIHNKKSEVWGEKNQFNPRGITTQTTQIPKFISTYRAVFSIPWIMPYIFIYSWGLIGYFLLAIVNNLQHKIMVGKLSADNLLTAYQLPTDPYLPIAYR